MATQSNDQAISNVVNQEIPQEILRMQRKLVVEQFYQALRGQPLKQDVEELIDGIVLLAVAQLWAKIQQQRSNNQP